MKKKNQRVQEFCHHPYNVCCMVLGVILLAKAFICAIIYHNIQSFVEEMAHQELAVTHNSLFFGLWKNPPVKPELHVYIFNFTNAYEYIAGNHTKPIMQVCRNNVTLKSVCIQQLNLSLW